MRISFRQGIVSHQSTGFLQFNGIGNVDILAGTRPVTITVAEKNSNYTFTEDANIVNAWIGPFTIGQSYWLYWEFDTQTFARTFNKTAIVPSYGAVQPSNPVATQIWFNTTTNEMFRYSGTVWIKIIAVFAAVAFNSTVTSFSIDAPLFTGTQIGNTASILSGRPLFTSAGRVIRKADNTFFTTEDDIFINDSQSAAIRLESNVIRGKNTEAAMAEFNIVAFSGSGEIRTAQYDDAQSTITAILMETLIQNQVGVVVPQGVVTNPNWNWTQDVGTPLWIENGALTSVDPHVTNSVLYNVPKTPVARVISTDTVLFEQGLGGVGPKGAKGSVSGQTAATTTTLGSVALSTPPAIAAAPVVVSDTDPRIAGGPFSPASHTHAASNITFVPSGSITANNVQAAILQSVGNAAQRTGDTFTGALVLYGAPAAPLEAATKDYVDTAVSGFAPAAHTHAAGDITLSPVGGVSATTVQAGVAELDGDKYDKTGGTISGNVTITGTTGHTGLATFTAGLTTQDDVGITGALTVTTTGFFTGVLTTVTDTNVGGDLGVTGATTSGTLTVTGLATLQNDLDVTGNSDFTGTVDVTGTLAAINNATVGGTLTITGATTLGGAPTLDLHAATKKYVDDSVSAGNITELPYDLTFFIAGPAAPVANAVVGIIVVPRTVTIASGAANVFGRALTAPAVTVVYEIYKGAVVVGTITFDPAVNSGLVPTYNFASLVTVIAGEHLEVRPTTNESNIANVGVTIIGCSTDLTCP